MEGRIAVVTGAGQGIGAAIARHLAERGAHVVVADRNAATGGSVAGAVGGSFVEVDVTDPTSVRAMTEAALAQHGRIDGHRLPGRLLEQLVERGHAHR